MKESTETKLRNTGPTSRRKENIERRNKYLKSLLLLILTNIYTRKLERLIKSLKIKNIMVLDLVNYVVEELCKK